MATTLTRVQVMRGDERMPLRVLIVAPERHGQTAVERQLEKTARAGLEVVARAYAETHALQQFFRCAPDLVILDCDVVPAEPARLVGLLKRMAPGSRIIAVVPALDSVAASAARALGADAIGVLADLSALLDGVAAADVI